jgi:hypothetical protein
MEALTSYFNGKKCCDFNLGFMMKTKAKEICWEQVKIIKGLNTIGKREKETFWRLSKWIIALGVKSLEVSWILWQKKKG